MTAAAGPPLRIGPLFRTWVVVENGATLDDAIAYRTDTAEVVQF